MSKFGFRFGRFTAQSVASGNPRNISPHPLEVPSIRCARTSPPRPRRTGRIRPGHPRDTPTQNRRAGVGGSRPRTYRHCRPETGMAVSANTPPGERSSVQRLRFKHSKQSSAARRTAASTLTRSGSTTQKLCTCNPQWSSTRRTSRRPCTSRPDGLCRAPPFRGIGIPAIGSPAAMQWRHPHRGIAVFEDRVKVGDADAHFVSLGPSCSRARQPVQVNAQFVLLVRAQ